MLGVDSLARLKPFFGNTKGNIIDIHRHYGYVCMLLWTAGAWQPPLVAPSLTYIAASLRVFLV